MRLPPRTPIEQIYQDFKGKDEIHIVLNPDDIDAFISIGTFSKNALRKVGPRANESQWEKYASVVELYQEKIKAARTKSLTVTEKAVK